MSRYYGLHVLQGVECGDSTGPREKADQVLDWFQALEKEGSFDIDDDLPILVEIGDAGKLIGWSIYSRDEIDKKRSADEMRQDIENDECVVLHADGKVMVSGKPIGCIGCEFADEGAALKAIKEEMDRSHYWSNIYKINDRGNVMQIDIAGNELRSWV